MLTPTHLKQKDIDLYTYRIESLVQSISLGIIKSYKSFEIQKILLKSKKKIPCKRYSSTSKWREELKMCESILLIVCALKFNILLENLF